MKFLALLLLCSLTFAAPVGRDKVNKHASTHESGNDKVDHDLLQGFVANEHLDWTSDQGATNIDDNNVPHTALTSDPHSVTKAQVGLGNVADVLDKLDATVAPGATDDSGAGYSEGSNWIDVTADKTYQCVDSTASAAVWKDTSASGGADADAIHDNVASEISAITEKTTPVSADLIIIEDSAAGNVKKRVQIGNLPGGGGAVFGTEYQSAESLGISSTTSTTYVEKLKLTTGTVAAGDYKIEWGYEQSTDKASTPVAARVHVDDTTVCAENNYQRAALGQFSPDSGFCVVTLTNAVHTVDIDHKTDSGAGTGSNIQSARILIFRVN